MRRGGANTIIAEGTYTSRTPDVDDGGAGGGKEGKSGKVGEEGMEIEGAGRSRGKEREGMKRA